MLAVIDDNIKIQYVIFLIIRYCKNKKLLAESFFL